MHRIGKREKVSIFCGSLPIEQVDDKHSISDKSRDTVGFVHRHIYWKLDVQFPIRPVLKIVPDRSIICAWQISQGQWLRFITTDILLILRITTRVKFSSFFTNFPNFDLGKHFLSTQTAFFYFCREKGIDKFPLTFSKFLQKWYKIALIFC